MTPDASFRFLLVGSFISFMGSAISAVAFPVLAITMLGASEVDMALIGTASAAATLLLSLSLAAWVEFRPKRPLMQLSLLVRGVVWAIVPVLAWRELLTIPMLVAASFVVACAALVHGLSSMAHLKDLVGQEHYAHAFGRLQSGQWLSLTLVPLVGGVLTGWVGAQWVLLLDAASFVAAFAAMSLMPKPEGEPVRKASATPHLHDVVQGLAVVARQPLLRLMLASWAIFAAGTAAMSPLTSVLYLGECQFSGTMYGVVMAVGSLAGRLASWFTSRITGRWGELPVHVWAAVARSPWQFLAAAVPSGVPGVVVASTSFAGVLTFSSVGNVAGGTVRAALTPVDALARVAAVWQFVPAALSPPLIFGAAWLAERVGTRSAIVGLSALLMASALMLLPLLKPRPTQP